jgi:hypothetical protein
LRDIWPRFGYFWSRSMSAILLFYGTWFGVRSTEKWIHWYITDSIILSWFITKLSFLIQVRIESLTNAIEEKVLTHTYDYKSISGLGKTPQFRNIFPQFRKLRKIVKLPEFRKVILKCPLFRKWNFLFYHNSAANFLFYHYSAAKFLFSHNSAAKFLFSHNSAAKVNIAKKDFENVQTGPILKILYWH